LLRAIGGLFFRGLRCSLRVRALSRTAQSTNQERDG
jgi:hypothetical protein